MTTSSVVPSPAPSSALSPAGPWHLPPLPGDRAEKRRRVLGLLRQRGAEQLVLRRPGNVSWYLDGVRAHVLLAVDAGVCAVVVSADGDTVVTARNEVDRLVAEELPADVSVEVREWHDPLVPETASGGAVLEDTTADVDDALRPLRTALLPGELERYRSLGRDTAQALTTACLSLEPSAPEHHAAARVAAEMLERGAEPLVLLVAGAERAVRHRHPLPTAAALGDRAMLVVCARRQGLIASATRWVSFGALPPRVGEDFARIREVDAAFLAATRPGRTVGEVLADGVAAYARHGFAADEWTRHHQGGPAGYFARDPVATPGSDLAVAATQAYAWNPSGPGVKSEDTVVVGAEGVEVLTRDEAWPPAGTEQGIARPGVLER